METTQQQAARWDALGLGEDTTEWYRKFFAMVSTRQDMPGLEEGSDRQKAQALDFYLMYEEDDETRNLDAQGLLEHYRTAYQEFLEEEEEEGQD